MIINAKIKAEYFLSWGKVKLLSIFILMLNRDRGTLNNP